MHANEKWEEELDAIAEAIRAEWKGDEYQSEGFISLVDASQLAVWFNGLVDLLAHCQHENNPEELSEVLDVLALLLKMCSRGQWRYHLQANSSQSRSFFLRASLHKIVNAVESVCASDVDDEEENHSAAAECLSALFFIASNADDLEPVLEVLRGLPSGSSIQNALQTKASTAHNNFDKWTRHFLRFVVMFLLPQPRISDGERHVLRDLTGANVSDWIQQTWETKWHLHRSAPVGKQLLGSATQLIANLRCVLDGISIPPVDPAASGVHSEATAIMALRYVGENRGLCHGVDVTLIKDGQVHPVWAKRSGRDRVVRPHDVDKALQDGYTIGIRGIHARSLPVHTLCDALQREVGQHVNANLYWTPPGQQGFDIHVDDHCVFVVQLKGSKRWFLYKPLETRPTLYDDTTAALLAHTPLLDTEILLEEGDVLYVPRGVPHHADTNGFADESIHLTIGVEIEQAHTAERVIHELAEPSEFKHTWHFKVASRIKNQGLMSWHLESTDAFLSWLSALTEDNFYQLPDDAHDELKDIRRRLYEERQIFLHGRSTTARAMATLHATQWNDSKCVLSPTAAMLLRVPAPELGEADARPLKKHRLE